MKINEYYRIAANLSLNGSIAALIPTFFIVFVNLSFIDNPHMMLLTIPFFIYSFFCFQVYLFRTKQSISIARIIANSNTSANSLFHARHLLVFYLNSLSPKLQIYHPDGHLAGSIIRIRRKMFRNSKVYVLYDIHEAPIGFFKVKGKKFIRIEVFDQNRRFAGSLEIRKHPWRKAKKELFDASGRFIGSVEGSPVFMDEHVVNKHHQPIGRLRRGWMPPEWCQLFPNPNTPVLTWGDLNTERDKLLGMSFLIHEFFMER